MLLLVSLQVVTSIPSEKFPYFENVTEGHQVFMNSYLKKTESLRMIMQFLCLSEAIL